MTQKRDERPEPTQHPADNNQGDARGEAGGPTPPLGGDGKPEPPLRGDSLPDYVPPPQRDGQLLDLAEDAIVAIMYIGPKAWTFDSVAGSGTEWNGKGDVKPVPVKAARKLLGYPTVWVRASDVAGELPTGEEQKKAAAKAAKDKVATEPEDMTREQLVEYAQRHLGIVLDPDLTKPQMIKRIKDEITQGDIDAENKRRNEVTANEAKKK